MTIDYILQSTVKFQAKCVLFSKSGARTGPGSSSRLPGSFLIFYRLLDDTTQVTVISFCLASCSVITEMTHDRTQLQGFHLFCFVSLASLTICK